MSSQKYESDKLNSILESLIQKKKSGIISLKTQVPHWQVQRTCILIWQEGTLIYGDLNVSQVPTNQEICQLLGKKLKPNSSEAALSVALERAKNPNSARELTELFIAMKVFTWQEVEALMTHKAVAILEQFLPYSGMAKWQANHKCDLSYGSDRHGLNWSDIQQEIARRLQKWGQYAPHIPSMDAIPLVNESQLPQISDRNVKKHLVSSANGQNNLFDIADKMGKDPLKVAKSYATWSTKGWVGFTTTPQAKENIVDNVKAKIESIQKQIKSPETVAPKNKQNISLNDDNLPIVLSVDDSPIIQTSIKRALQEQYRVLLASKTADALNMLNEHPVKLMLLDLTMPDMDGLEFCKIVRKIDEFRELPIVMVTARDGLVNKMKGHIAGSSRYLTKPFQPEQLREVVAEYIK